MEYVTSNGNNMNMKQGCKWNKMNKQKIKNNWVKNVLTG